MCFGVSTNAIAEDCWQKAAKEHKVPARILKAIASVESSFRPDAYEQLDDSESIGLMQINSFWFDLLEEKGIHQSELWEPCTNISVGAWILAQEIERYGYNWISIGSYNAGAYTQKTKGKKLKLYAKYAEKVYRALMIAKQNK